MNIKPVCKVVTKTIGLYGHIKAREIQSDRMYLVKLGSTIELQKKLSKVE